MHRQQLLDALDRPNDLDPMLVRPVLLAMRWAYPLRLAGVRAAAGDTVAITVTGPVSESWFIVANGEGWDFGTAPGARTVASLSMTTDQAWRLLTNNLPPERTNSTSAATPKS